MEIDAKKIEEELKGLAGQVKLKVKLDKQMTVASCVAESDKGYFIRLNPHRIRSPQKLEEHLTFCRNSIAP